MMIPITLLLVTLFVVFFISAVFSDQFEDLETPRHQILLNDNIKASNHLEIEKGEER
jgi:cbb3-type cytochrome oxidase maturation protein